jgi:hypothetical protein
VGRAKSCTLFENVLEWCLVFRGEEGGKDVGLEKNGKRIAKI